jgi:vacuolar-type H+-ATPase subunit I/STV1
MTSTEPYTAAASQAREATEKSVEAWTRNAKSFVDRTNVVAAMPSIDLTTPVERFFEYVQKAVDLNRDLATTWAELMSTLSGQVKEQAEKATHVVVDQAEAVGSVVTSQAKKAEEVAKEQAELAEETKKEQERLARKAEREEAKQAHEDAREPYEGLSKAELTDLLVERELPKTGNIEELIERLVEADTK